ncbi:MAG: matrixin family metalloprotease [Candidatus Geothermarchaeales archaeon]
MTKKKISLLICFVLVLSVFAPIVAITAGKPDTVPPPLEKRVFIHHKKGVGKPPGTPGGGPPPKEEDHSDHYKFLGKGVKWKTTPVSYVIDPDNPQGLTEEFIVTAIFLSAEEWDEHAGIELFSDSYTVDYGSSWDDDAPDGRNEVVFGDYPREGVIAVTVVWGYFSGPPGQREIIEFDIMFDTDFTWGNATESGDAVMDLQNIATHEIGHGAGLDDYNLCDLETMYGYSQYGETMKRDLYLGDTAGIQKLYG